VSRIFQDFYLISVVEKMVSEAEIIISATDTAFAVSEKMVGGAPAVVVHQQPTIRSCEKRAHMPRLVQVSGNFAISAVQKADSFWSAPMSGKTLKFPVFLGSMSGVLRLKLYRLGLGIRSRWI
jgi:hypothetical protein